MGKPSDPVRLAPGYGEHHGGEVLTERLGKTSAEASKISLFGRSSHKASRTWGKGRACEPSRPKHCGEIRQVMEEVAVYGS